MDTFLQEFRDGMAEPNRARSLGDVHDSAPDHWQFGGNGDGKEIGLVLMLYAADASALDALAGDHLARVNAAGLKVVTQIDTVVRPDNREPFGFVDGLSQPRVEGIDPDSEVDRPGEPVVRAGEFVLGYENGYDKLPFSPRLNEALDTGNILPPLQDLPGFRDLGRNGTYLVVRKLEQDVAAFQSFVDDRAVNPETGVADPSRAEWLAAKLMGRWRGGAPVTKARDRDDPDLAASSDKNNAFDYQDDEEGLGCPFGAHARRTNPRHPMPNVHRIIRRGRPYEERLTDGKAQARGVVFVAINANIGRQFEFIQQSWMNNPSFEGLQDNRDPVVGANHQEGVKEPLQTYAMVVPANPFRIRLTGIARFVHTRGGEYFFLPGRKALRFLATSGYESRQDLVPPAPADHPPAPSAYASPGDSANVRASVAYQDMSIE
jgi:Dyp-type peroxidase family